MSSSDTTQKININKKSLAGEEEKQLQFSVVKQLQDEGPLEAGALESAESSQSHDTPRGDFAGNVVPHLQLVKLQSNVDKLESQIKLISTFVSETKILEAEMNKIIKKIYQAQPKLKPYLMRMKKLLKNHTDIENILEIAKDKVEESPNAKDVSRENVKPLEKKELELKKAPEKANDEPEDPNFTREMSLADLMAMQSDDDAA